jgi:hypothetical protein
VLAEGVRRAARAAGVELVPGAEDALAASLPEWPVFHDIVPADRLGIRSVWVNRGADGDDPSLATAVLPDLRRLPEVVEDLLGG